MPVYNAERFLDRSIPSVLGQTLSDFELLAVDDGSTDASAALLDSYAAGDARVMVVHQPNRGVSRARNEGLSRANGRYVTFIDSDDVFELRRLERLATLIEGSEPDAIVTGFKKIDHGTGDVIESCEFNERAVLQDAIKGDWSVIWRLCAKREIVSSVTFPEFLQYGEDYVFYCRVLLACRSVKYAQNAVDSSYLYRVNNRSSLMQRQSLNEISQQCAATEYLERFVLDSGMSDCSIMRALNARKNWCRRLLFNETITMFGMRRHVSLRLLKKGFSFLIKRCYPETRE